MTEAELLGLSEAAEAIKAAFFEGYASFATQASAYNTDEEAWRDSDAKMVHDGLLARSQPIGVASRDQIEKVLDGLWCTDDERYGAVYNSALNAARAAILALFPVAP